MNREKLTWELEVIKSKLKESRRIQLEQECEGCLEELEELMVEGKFNKEQIDIITNKLKNGLMYGIHTVVRNYDGLI